MGKAARLIVLLAVLSGLLSAGSPASATTIVVNTTADVLDIDDGRCSLREAVFACRGRTVTSAPSSSSGAGAARRDVPP